MFLRVWSQSPPTIQVSFFLSPKSLIYCQTTKKKVTISGDKKNQGTKKIGDKIIECIKKVYSIFSRGHRQYIRYILPNCLVNIFDILFPTALSLYSLSPTALSIYSLGLPNCLVNIFSRSPQLPCQYIL